jgi:hypothetical protein
MVDKPVYEDNKFEILKTRYVEQAANLRDFNDFDLKVLGGFITIQLGLASWFGSHSLPSSGARIAIALIDLAALVVCWRMLKGVRRRRDETRCTIRHINEAFGLYSPGIYLEHKAINPTPISPGNYRWLVGGCVAAFAGVMMSLFIPHPPGT